MNIYSISGSVPGKPGFPLRLLWGLLGKRTPRGHDLILTAALRDRHRRPDAPRMEDAKAQNITALPSPRARGRAGGTCGSAHSPSWREAGNTCHIRDPPAPSGTRLSRLPDWF